MSLGHFLIVEDEEIIGLTLKDLLGLRNIDSVYFPSPKQALSYLANHRPSLIISDYSMPEMDGIEFYKRTRFMGNTSEFLLVTGNMLDDRFLHILKQAGLSEHDYLSKPFTVKSLNAAIDRKMNLNKESILPLLPTGTTPYNA